MIIPFQGFLLLAEKINCPGFHLLAKEINFFQSFLLWVCPDGRLSELLHSSTTILTIYDLYIRNKNILCTQTVYNNVLVFMLLQYAI